MNKLIITLAMMGIALAAVPAHADVSYQPSLGLNELAKDFSGNPLVDGTYAMILDRDNNGWNGNSYLLKAPVGAPATMGNTWLFGDTNDLLLDLGKIENGIAFPSKTISGNPATTISGYDAGVDHYYLLWFDKAFNAANLGPGAGTFYGAEDLGVAGADGFTLTPDALGGKATLQTLGTQPVPEPVSSVLALIGGGAMALRRKFRFGAVKV